MLLLSFDVSYAGKQDVFVTINHIKNCLSGTSAPYPNRNTTFTYMLSGSEPLRQLDIAFSAGNYSIENVTAFTFPLSAIKLPEITSFYPAETTGRELLKGSITMAEDGFFVTSFAFSQGYTALADGQKVTPVPINKGFVGFPLKKGTHEITLEFHAPGKMAGIFISSLASLYFIVELLLYCLRSARHKKRILRGV